MKIKFKKYDYYLSQVNPNQVIPVKASKDNYLEIQTMKDHDKLALRSFTLAKLCLKSGKFKAAAMSVEMGIWLLCRCPKWWKARKRSSK
jgi:hypothetical protein